MEGVWGAFLEVWATLYTRYPNTTWVYQEAYISREAFHTLAEYSGTTLQLSGTESHNSLGVVERYNMPLRRVFSVIRRDNPQLHPEIALHRDLKGINDTMGPDGLVETLLVFGTFPTIPTASYI